MDGHTDELGDAPLRAADCVLPLGEADCARLVELHGPTVKAACQRILNDASLAEDVTQEVFLLFVRKLPFLPPTTVLGGWLYITACRVARTHQRTTVRRQIRENQPEVIEHLMKSAKETLWSELEPLLDNAMLSLPARQRELVVLRYLQNNTQRAAAAVVGCSESVASRELAAALERLRRFFTRRGIVVSATTLTTLLATHGSAATVGLGNIAALSSASALASSFAVEGSLFITLMKTTTTTKVLAAAAVFLTLGTISVYYATRDNVDQLSAPITPLTVATDRDTSALNDVAEAGTDSRGFTTGNPAANSNVNPQVFDQDMLDRAREVQETFWRRMDEFALMTDATMVQELLQGEYGIRLTLEEIRALQKGGQKFFLQGICKLWGTKQPVEALAWATSALPGPTRPGWNLHQSLLEAAREALPELNRERLTGMLPDGPGKATMLDLIEAATEPTSLGNRILSISDPGERAERLKLLAQGWPDPVTSTAWARENLTGEDRLTFFQQVSYNLAEQNPQAGLQLLAELQGTDAYVPVFMSMMRGLAQEGGQGQKAAELIATSNLTREQRSQLITELARRWVRNDADAAVDWANSFTDLQDFRAAFPLVVAQLDDDHIRRTVQAYLQNPDPVMELGLIEAAAPPSIVFDPERARMILDPLISRDPNFKLVSGEGNLSAERSQLPDSSRWNKEEVLWQAVALTATRHAEKGDCALAMEWLGGLPFAGVSDYAKAAAGVLSVWNIKSPSEAAAWLNNSNIDPARKAELLNAIAANATR